MTLVQPSPELQINIRKELNEDVNTRDSDLEHIKEWLLKQPHLPDTWGGKVKDIDTPNMADIIKVVLMVGDVRLAAEETGVAGDVYILDASVATANHFAKITPSIIKKFFVCIQEAYPVKLKEVHVVNVSPLVDTIVNWVKPFLKEKIRNRIHLHSELESLHKFIPKDILPEEYGGSAGKVQDFHDQWMKKLEEYTPWFKSQEDIKADESKRPGKPTNYDDLFGLDGSFRQLTID
ncbi:hypothetical protein NQ318_021701 [Aromia moschata]|uniref:CRAL-TRIO domain-containing protein n=1 Tax=Aromia moschata TaxID=1265417 RepID=A0AAV8YC96_9CUCU|nr:hypothetical protein NQ318_021701 [Aromia moschata]